MNVCFEDNNLHDAGADYFLKDDEQSGGVTLDFETVYSQAAGADYWRIVNSYQGAVSYTHLDVYKRQMIMALLPGIWPLI